MHHMLMSSIDVIILVSKDFNADYFYWTATKNEGEKEERKKERERQSDLVNEPQKIQRNHPNQTIKP